MVARAMFDAAVADGWKAVQGWIREKERESQYLDFKTCPQPDPNKMTDRTEATVAKAVSGFANAEGGLLVLGIKTTTPLDGGEDAADKLERIRNMPAFAARLRKLLPVWCDPPVPSVLVHEIPDPEHPLDGVILVYVPPSDRGPHRTAAQLPRDIAERYYLRNGPHTNSMAHSLLSLMFGRRFPPKLCLGLQISLKGSGLVVRLCLENVGRSAAMNTALQLDQELETKPLSWFLAKSENFTVMPESHGETQRVTLQASAGLVVYPEQSIQCAWLVQPVQADSSIPLRIKGTVFALDMRPLRFDSVVHVVQGEQRFRLPDE